MSCCHRPHVGCFTLRFRAAGIESHAWRLAVHFGADVTMAAREGASSMVCPAVQSPAEQATRRLTRREQPPPTPPTPLAPSTPPLAALPSLPPRAEKDCRYRANRDDRTHEELRAAAALAEATTATVRAELVAAEQETTALTRQLSELREKWAAHERSSQREERIEARLRRESIIASVTAEVEAKVSRAAEKRRISELQALEYVQREELEDLQALHDAELSVDVEARRLADYNEVIASLLREELETSEAANGVLRRLLAEDAALKAEMKEMEASLAKARRLTDKAQMKVENLKEQLGLRYDCPPPPPQRAGESSEAARQEKKWQVKFMTAVLKSRDPGHIASAIAACGGRELLLRLADTPEFDVIAEHVAQQCHDSIQSVWNARHSVHVMYDVNLSRRLFELLRHLLSYKYMPPGEEESEERSDFYFRRRMWESQHNAKRFVAFPELQPRKPREAEAAEIFAGCNIEQSEDGTWAGATDLAGSVRDWCSKCWREGAISEEVVSGTRPLMLMLFGDATGGWRGSPITHIEWGIASMQSGLGCSKNALQPCFLGEGKDSTPTLRGMAGEIFRQWDAIAEQGSIDIVDDKGAVIHTVKVSRPAARPLPSPFSAA